MNSGVARRARGRLGQHAGDVVERRDPVEAEVAPAGIDGVIDDAGKVRLFLFVRHVRAVPAQLAPEHADRRTGGSGSA